MSSDAHATQVGAMIREAREQSGRTATQLAAEVGCSLRSIRYWESGEVRVSRRYILPICTALDLDPMVVLGLA